MRISVTDSHILLGRKGVAQSCPVALAMAAVGYAGAAVGRVSVRFREGDGIVVLPLPDDVTAFVDAFDLGEPVGPFEFHLTH